MGQEISLLYTKDPIQLADIPKGQIYFKDKAYWMFPFDIDGDDMGQMIRIFKRFEDFKTLYEHKNALSNNARIILDLIHELNIKNCLVMHYAEWGDMPYDVANLIIKNHGIYQASDYDAIEEILGYFETIEASPDLDRYRSYSMCERLFQKKNK